MKVIGLCGGSGSGKSCVTRIFSELGFSYINTDSVYHDLISQKSECLDALISEFGANILSDFGVVDRKKLANIVFAENAADKLKRLNEISHFYVLKKTREIISSLDSLRFPGVIVDAPLLFESQFHKECDAVIAVIADVNLRIKRITERDGISEEEAKRRISVQMTDGFLIENADYVIRNSSDYSELEKQVVDLAEKIKNL